MQIPSSEFILIAFTAFNFFICSGVNSAINICVSYLSKKQYVKVNDYLQILQIIAKIIVILRILQLIYLIFKKNARH